MKKKILPVLCALLIALAVASPVAYASTGTTSQTYCVTTTESWNYKLVSRLVDQANDYIAWQVRFAQLTPWDDVDPMLERIKVRVDFVMRMADIYDCEVECEYVAYVIDGRRVMIDPLRVVPPINRPGGH